jgi:carbamoyltransferase
MTSEYVYILGVPNFANYESSTALLRIPRRGGEIDYVSIGEDRTTRLKHPYHFPLRGIDYCLRHFGLESLQQVDWIATDYARLPRWLNSGPGYRKLEHDYLKLNLRFPRERILILDHHDAHAASCYYPSGFDEAGVLIVDGMGSELNTQSAYHFRGDSVTWSERGYDWGIGRLYSLVTGGILPYGPEKGYGKVMGLAPYGRNAPGPVLDFLGEQRGMRTDYSAFFTRFPISRLTQTQVPHCRDRAQVMDHPYPRAAYEVQEECERQLIAFARHIHEQTGTRRLCISGGVALNGRANYEILRQTPIKEIWVQPGCSDTGIPFGLALWAYYQKVARPAGDARASVSMRHAYCGSPYDAAQIDATLERYGVRHRPENIEQTAAWLADGKIVAVFEGASEYGPRALGHRSILADPRREEMKDRLNTSVKFREPYRPYAPVVLREHVNEYFELDCDSPFMLIVADVRKEKRAVIPSVTHVDGTARVQTVTRADNGRYYELLEAFYRHTGVPVLLNTSFNVNREPIVETPIDALICAFGTSIDYLILEGRVIECAPYRDTKLVERMEADRKAHLDAEYRRLTAKYLHQYNREEMERYLQEENRIADWYRDYRAKYELEKLMDRWRAERRRVLVIGTPAHTKCLYLFIPEFPGVAVSAFARWQAPGEQAEFARVYPEISPEQIDWSSVDEILVSSHEYQRDILSWLADRAPPGKPVHALYDGACDSLLFVLPGKWPVMNIGDAERHGLTWSGAGKQRTASAIDFDFEPARIEIGERYAVAINYHDVRPAQPPARLSFGPHETPERLAGQVKALKEKFSFCRVRDLVDPKADLPESTVILTFDDGLRSVNEHTLPVLRSSGTTASIYVCALPYVEQRVLDVQKIQLLTAKLGRERFQRAFAEELARQNARGVEREPMHYADGYAFYRYDDEATRAFKLDLNYRLPYALVSPVLETLFREAFGAERDVVKEIYLSVDELKLLVDQGFELGVHGYDHKVLPRLTFEQQRENLRAAIEFLTPIAGHGLTLSCPYGFSDDGTKRAMKELGLQAGLSLGRKMITPEDIQARWQLPRYDVNDCFAKTDNALRNEVFSFLSPGD